MRIAVTNRPPQLWVLQAQGGMGRGIKLDAFPGRAFSRAVPTDPLLEWDLSKATAQRPGHRPGLVAEHIDRDCHVGARTIRQRQRSADQRIFECRSATRGERNIPYDASIPTANGWNPVPADRGMIGGVVGPQSTAVGAAVLVGLLFTAPWSSVLFDSHGEGIVLTRTQFAGYVEAAPHESAFHAADALSIQEDLGFPVNALEVEPRHLSRSQGGCAELGAVPEVRVEE